VRRGSLGFAIGRIARTPLGGRARHRRERLMARLMSATGRTLALAAVVLVAASFSVQAWRVGYQNYQLHKQIDAIEAQNRALASDAVKLQRDVELSKNPEYLVPLIHEHLGLTKPHEVIIQVATPAPK
jgi:cell division protein FtsB